MVIGQNGTVRKENHGYGWVPPSLSKTLFESILRLYICSYRFVHGGSEKTSPESNARRRTACIEMRCFACNCPAQLKNESLNHPFDNENQALR